MCVRARARVRVCFKKKSKNKNKKKLQLNDQYFFIINLTFVIQVLLIMKSYLLESDLHQI